MSKPLTRNRDQVALSEFRNSFRTIVSRNRVARLELFLYLSFPQECKVGEGGALGRSLIDALHSVAPPSVLSHRLFKGLERRLDVLDELFSEGVERAGSKALTVEFFREIIAAIRDVDAALDRFDAAVTASLTDVDELTGLFNRLAMEKDLERELDNLHRGGGPVSIAMVDADHFKRINDTWGHTVGDAVLVELAGRFEEALRPRDRVYRFGGEEFLIMLPDTSVETAISVLERLRKDVYRKPILSGRREVLQTVSAGVALAESGDLVSDVIRRADSALYEAKASGRNCTRVYT